VPIDHALVPAILVALVVTLLLGRFGAAALMLGGLVACLVGVVGSAFVFVAALTARETTTGTSSELLFLASLTAIRVGILLWIVGVCWWVVGALVRAMR
jgi:hypothetical protein